MISHILRFDGISLDDLYLKPVKKTISKEETVSKFQSIPVLFTSIERWPSKTNLRCWWCYDNHENYPKFIPTSIQSNGHCTPFGSFCEWSCAAAYVTSFMSGSIDTLENLKLYCQKFTGKNVLIIPRSPSPHVRQEFIGGSRGITNEAYRKKLEQLNARYNELDL